MGQDQGAKPSESSSLTDAQTGPGPVLEAPRPISGGLDTVAWDRSRGRLLYLPPQLAGMIDVIERRGHARDAALRRLAPEVLEDLAAGNLRGVLA